MNDVVHLEWSEPSCVTAAEGPCAAVLGEEPDALLGLPLASALGASEEALAPLLRAVRERERTPVFLRRAERGSAPRWLRLTPVWEPRPGCWVQDFGALLAGAPLLQVDRLASSLSHELRNPLSSIKMAVQTVAKTASLSELDARRLAIAQKEIRTIERLLAVFSEYGREAPLNLETVTLRHVHEEAVAQLTPELTERNLSMRVVERAPGDLSTPIRAELGRLRPVLAQLLLGATNGLPAGAALVIEAAQRDGTAMLIWQDISAKADPRAPTEPFQSMLARGAGLSLASMNRLMQAHGGQLGLEPAEPGTRYTLSFPA